MNVRFFNGTKAQYLSLPVPRNPLGLYFCEDTKELFWADRLLTDGTRIVPAFTDLPSIEKAADGITYFVEETRNGYVLSSDRTKWVQVIYAPETGGSVKAISFAGIEMEEADGVFTIDRRCAREALGFKVPEGMEDEEIVIATEAFVKTEIEKVNTPEVNLDGYATEQYVTKAIAAINPTVEEVKTKLEEEVLPKVNETILPTVQKVETEVIPTVQELAEKAATQDWVKGQGYLTAHQSLEEYAKKADIPDTSDFITMQEVEDKNYLTEVPVGFATEEFVNKKIAEAELADKEADLEAYYTKSEVNALIPDVSGLIKEIPDEYITESELEAKGYLTEHQSLEGYAKLSDLPSIDGLASESYVDEKVVTIEIPDVSDFITMSDVEAKNYLTEHQDISHLAEKDHTHANYATVDHEHEQYLTVHQDLSEYAKKSEIPVIDGLATEEYVNTAISGIEVSEAEIYKVDFNAPDYAKAVEAYNNGKVLVLVNAAPDVNSYAVMNYVSEKYIAFTKFLTSRSEAYGSFNTYYLSPANIWEVSKEVKLNKVEANAEGEVNGELASIRIGKEVYSLPNTKGLASTEYVDNAIANIEIPEVNLADYAKLTDIPDVSKFIEEIPVEYITEDKLNAKGYITEHQDLTDYAKKSDIPSIDGFASETFVEEKIAEIEIPEVPTKVSELENDAGYLTTHQSLEGYATEEFVAEAISNIDLSAYATKEEIPSTDGFATKQFVSDAIADIDIPEINLTNYYTKAETNEAITTALSEVEHPTIDLAAYALKSEVALKANNVLFTTDKFVATPLGGFSLGESVKDITIADLFAKLLGLVADLSDIPGLPDEPGNATIVEKILKNKLPMYQLAADGVLTALSYDNIIEIAAEEDALEIQPKPNQSGFYKILDTDKNAVEYGYQQVQVRVPYIPFMIALPDFIDYNTNVIVEMYRELDSSWQTTALKLTNNADEIADTCDLEGCKIPEVPEGYTLWVSKDAGVMSSNTVYRFIIIEKET